MTIELQAIEFNSACEAIQWVDSGEGGRAIRLADRFFVVEPAEADRLEADGVQFAFIGVCARSDGRHVIVTVPVN